MFSSALILSQRKKPQMSLALMEMKASFSPDSEDLLSLEPVIVWFLGRLESKTPDQVSVDALVAS